MIYPPDVPKPHRRMEKIFDETIKIEKIDVWSIYTVLSELINKDHKYKDAEIDIGMPDDDNTGYHLCVSKYTPESDENWNKKLKEYEDALVAREEKIKETEIKWLKKLADKHHYNHTCSIYHCPLRTKMLFFS